MLQLVQAVAVAAVQVAQDVWHSVQAEATGSQN